MRYHRNADERLRGVERSAAAGDPDAQARLPVERVRAGVVNFVTDWWPEARFLASAYDIPGRPAIDYYFYSYDGGSSVIGVYGNELHEYASWPMWVLIRHRDTPGHDVSPQLLKAVEIAERHGLLGVRNNPVSGQGRYRFVTDCIHSTGPDIARLVDGATKISQRTFRHKLAAGEWKALSDRLGYDRHLLLSSDPFVGYFKSVYRGAPAVFMTWSGIEQVFTLDGKQGPSADPGWVNTDLRARPGSGKGRWGRLELNPDEQRRRRVRRAHGGSEEEQAAVLVDRARSGELDWKRLARAAGLDYRPAILALAAGNHEYAELAEVLRDGPWAPATRATFFSRSKDMGVDATLAAKVMIGVLEVLREQLPPGADSLMEDTREWLSMAPGEERSEFGQEIADRYLDILEALPQTDTRVKEKKDGYALPLEVPKDFAAEAALHLAHIVGMGSGSHRTRWKWGWPTYRMEDGVTAGRRACYLQRGVVRGRKTCLRDMLVSIHRETLPWLLGHDQEPWRSRA